MRSLRAGALKTLAFFGVQTAGIVGLKHLLRQENRLLRYAAKRGQKRVRKPAWKGRAALVARQKKFRPMPERYER